jgi:hypothetical protein
MWLSLALLYACGGDDASGSGSGDNLFGNATGRPGDDSSSSSGGGSGSSGSGSGNVGGGELTGSEACKHVDVVISVDASSSMTEELQAMRDVVFPAFAQRLATLGAELDDFRFATLDACPQPANFHTRGASAECNFDGGEVWIDSSSNAMTDEFACVGDIFVEDQECTNENDDEQPATSIATALEEPMASGPNRGFQRDDALLIAIAITDEDEQPTNDQDSAEEVYNRLAELVADDPRRMVFLGIGGSRQCDDGAYGGAIEATKLREITNLFARHDRGVFWDLCEGRLEDGLEEAFRVIANACDELCGGLDEWCTGDPPGDMGNPFCQEYPDDPSCIVD